MRNTKVININTDNRDNGKAYFLKEMPAMRAEKWAIRALVALENSGFVLPEGVKGSGMIGIAAVGAQHVLTARLNFHEFEPLLDEMLECVHRIPNPDNEKVHRPLNEDQDDVEEVTTLLELRKEVLLLHLDFLPADARSKLTSILTPATSSTIQTSAQ